MTDFRGRVPSVTSLAKKMGRDYSNLLAVLKGQTIAGPHLALAIEEATHGAISKGELRPDLWPAA
jgi:DNA-binding transcriptional regulator YdaS (Cro superfamily)